MKAKKKAALLILLSTLLLTGCADLESFVYYHDIKPVKDFLNNGEPVKLSTKTMSKEQRLNSLGIYDGVVINGIDVGTKSKPAAKQILQEEMEKRDGETVIAIQAPKKTYKYYVSDLKVDYDYDGAIEKAFAVGRSGTEEERLKVIADVVDTPMEISLEPIFVEETIAAYVNAISNEVDVPAVDGTYKYENDEIVAVPGVDGRIVDREKFSEDLKQLLKNPGSVEIALMDDVAKQVDTEQVKANLGVIGTATTKYGSSSSGRKHNIKLSSEKLNGTVIAPKQSISLNEIVGNANAANGYKSAKVIVNGEFKEGYGGGVCQTSTTMYQAAVKADLTILERSHHSRPIGYTSKGLDAAISYNTQDLVIRNDFDFPVLIKSKADGSSLTFEVYGDTKLKDYEIKLSSKTTGTVGMRIKKIADGSLAPGETVITQKGWNGYYATSYKTNTKTGETVVLSKDYYPGRTQVVRYGP